MARRDLAFLERRDPTHIVALEKQINILEGKIPDDSMSEEEILEVLSDPVTKDGWGDPKMIAALNSLLNVAIRENQPVELVEAIRMEISIEESGINVFKLDKHERDKFIAAMSLVSNYTENVKRKK
jgi:hypothetical protein